MGGYTCDSYNCIFMIHGVGDGQGGLYTAVHCVKKGQTRLSDWTELNWYTSNTSLWIERKDNRDICYAIAVWFVSINNKTGFLIFPKIWTEYIHILKCNTKYYNKTTWIPKLKYHVFSLVMVRSIYMALYRKWFFQIFAVKVSYIWFKMY